MYLPKGSWIDLEREARLDGGWIVKEKRIDAIPLFLRENRGLFRLAEAPMHIADENFREITFVIQCAIAAAENERVPIIIQFYPGLDKYIPLNIISYIAKDLARKASVPVAVHLDHSAGYEIAMSGIRDGFPSVMVDGSSLPFEENVSLTAQVVKAASVFGVEIEAELGHVGIGQNLEDMNSNLFTNGIRRWSSPSAPAAEARQLPWAMPMGITPGNLIWILSGSRRSERPFPFPWCCTAAPASRTSR